MSVPFDGLAHAAGRRGTSSPSWRRPTAGTPARHTCRMRRRLSALMMAISLLAGCGDSPAITEAARSDADLYRQMAADPTVDLHPPDARRVGGHEDGPCKGDSGSGPHVIRDYDWAGGPEELLSFYSSHVGGLGWTFVSREFVRSTGRDYELFLWEKPGRLSREP